MSQAKHKLPPVSAQAPSSAAGVQGGANVAPNNIGDSDAASQGNDCYASSDVSHSNTSVSSAQQQQQTQYIAAAFQPSKHSRQPPLQIPQQSTAAQNGRQRATSLMAPKEMPQRLTKNYRELARDFRALKPFTRLPDGTYPLDTRCVFCEIGTPKTVFFPCQHKVACDVCIKLNDISPDRSRAGAWSACPVCMTDIRLMLPYTGKEEDEYWKWIAEVKPSLSPSFKNEFKDAAKKLRNNTVLPGGPLSPESPATATAAAQQSEQPGRRHTWHSPIAQSKGAQQTGGDLKSCTIL